MRIFRRVGPTLYSRLYCRRSQEYPWSSTLQRLPSPTTVSWDEKPLGIVRTVAEFGRGYIYAKILPPLPRAGSNTCQKEEPSPQGEQMRHVTHQMRRNGGFRGSRNKNTHASENSGPKKLRTKSAHGSRRNKDNRDAQFKGSSSETLRNGIKFSSISIHVGVLRMLHSADTSMQTTTQNKAKQQ